MRITKIEIAGGSRKRSRKGRAAAPPALAEISREPNSEYIEVTIISSTAPRRKHLVHAADIDDQWSMAERLQEALDGRRGTNSMIHDVYRIIQMLAD